VAGIEVHLELEATVERAEDRRARNPAKNRPAVSRPRFTLGAENGEQIGTIVLTRSRERWS